jgi:hypothetical protein
MMMQQEMATKHNDVMKKKKCLKKEKENRKRMK